MPTLPISRSRSMVVGQDQGIETPDDLLLPIRSASCFNVAIRSARGGTLGSRSLLVVIVEGELEVVVDAHGVDFIQVAASSGCGILGPEDDQAGPRRRRCTLWPGN